VFDWGWYVNRSDGEGEVIMSREDCYQCDGDGYAPGAGNCSRCGGGGKETPRPDLRELLKQVADNRIHERHRTIKETAYWCSQWRLLAEALADHLADHAAPAVAQCVCRVDDGLVQEWVAKARAVARSKGFEVSHAAPAVIETLKSYCVSCGHYRVLTHRWIGEEDCWKWLCQPCLDEIVGCD
jgi:hypothetical protein